MRTMGAMRVLRGLVDVMGGHSEVHQRNEDDGSLACFEGFS